MRNKGDVLDTLKQAIAHELYGQRMYLELAERTSDRLGQRAFHSFVRSEVEHQRILQNQYDSMMHHKKWLTLDYAQRVDPSGPSTTLFPQEVDANMTRVEGTADDLGALQLAMDYERQGYEMYIRAAMMTDTTGQVIYQYLAQEENEHLTLLKKFHDHLYYKRAWHSDGMDGDLL